MLRGKNTIPVLAALLVSIGTWAQEGAPSGSPWNVTLQGGAGYVAPTFDWRDEMMSTYVYPVSGIAVGYQTTEKDSPYAALFGYPNFGVGLGWEGFSTLRYNGISRLGDIFNLYGFAERTLLQRDWFSLDFVFDLGAGFNGTFYDPERNPLNRNFGARLAIFVCGGLDLHVPITEHLEAGISARFNHYSSGRLAYPNAGLNNPAACLSLRYRNAKPPKGRPAGTLPDPPSRFFCELYAGAGIHRCAIEWSVTGTTRPWAIFSFGGSANFRYRPHLSTGLAVDMYAETPAFLGQLEKYERKLYGDEKADAYGPYRGFSAGAGVIQHLHYGNFSAFATVGAYLYRHNGLHDQRGKLYQRIGLKYLLPGSTGLFVAMDCKAHGFSRAAMMELTLGIRL